MLNIFADLLIVIQSFMGIIHGCFSKEYILIAALKFQILANSEIFKVKEKIRQTDRGKDDFQGVLLHIS